jgi:hypothetical protein
VNFADTIRGLLRRWYIVIPGLVVTAAIVLGAWLAIPTGYQRSATQLLLPGANSMPAGANPYLFLGGLSPAADVLVRAIGANNVLNEVVEKHPGVQIEISRDTTTAGPIILITVTAGSDADAGAVLGLLIDRTSTVLDELQQEENIPAANRVSVIPVTVDTKSTLQQRSRILGAGGAGIVGLVLTLLIAGLVDGSSAQRKRRELSPGDDADTVADLRVASRATHPVESAAAAPKSRIKR